MQIREPLMACYKSMYQALFFSLSSQRSKEAKKKNKKTTTTTTETKQNKNKDKEKINNS